MRSIKLIPALAAMATLVALAPAGAAAQKHAARLHASPSSGCHLTIETPKSVITAGEPVSVSGALTCPTAASASGVAVTVYERPTHTGTHKANPITIAGAPTTETGGAYVFGPVTLTSNTAFYAIAGTARSAHKVVKVSPQVSLKGPAGSQLFTGGGNARTRALNNAEFKGTVSPYEPGEIVALQRENATANEEWRRVALGVVNGKGEYTITHTFGAPGDANLRAVARPKHFNAPGASSPLAYVISQVQNPKLTINASPDPITAGQAGGVTLSGVVAGAAAKQPLTLSARTHGGKFAPVAKGETESGGSYKFTQAPLQNTAYQVSSATTKSAVLFEGVKYALTVLPTASTAPAGQQLSVQGTASPISAGHAVYLERQNASKIGYHVVEVGTVAKDGTYSITHAFIGPGPATLRVAIPGDPQNQGVATPSFEVNVTPAPAGSLRPVAPSKLPGDGQL